MSLALIGGSGLFNCAELTDTQPIDCQTIYGSPSGEILQGSLGTAPVLFLARHGRTDRHIPPHKINYRANLQALAECGASAILTVNIVGGITAGPGSWVIPDQIIDYTSGREHTYSDGTAGRVDHVDMTLPYDPALSAELVTSAEAIGLPIVSGGTYACTQGPRLETAAEVQRLARDGCDIVGMTAMPEAALARELGIPYAGLCLVVNWGAGLGRGEITMEEIDVQLSAGMPRALELISCLLARR